MVKEFYIVIFSKKPEKLDIWIESAKKHDIPELQTFVEGILKDLSVKNGISYPYNNGLAEGSIKKSPRLSLHALCCYFSRVRTPCCRVELISIHVPAKERLAEIILGIDFGDFNPRSCEGATVGEEYDRVYLAISIHVPAKERLILTDT